MADVFFPAWGIPESALRYLLTAAILGVPIAIAVGLIIYSVADDVLNSATEDAIRMASVDKLPNSVAVLPFVNISGDADNEYFCDGISEEILHCLADYRDMHVLARTSSFAFKGNELGAARLSDILGVRYLLQGSVRKVGDDLRISAQLIDENDFQVWSRKLTRTRNSCSGASTCVRARRASKSTRLSILTRP